MLAVVHQAAHWRFGVGGNLYQIQFFFPGGTEALFQGDDTDLIAVLVNQPNFRNLYLVIDSGAILAALSTTLFNVSNLQLVIRLRRACS